MPPARGFETGVKVFHVVPGEQRTPYCRTREFDLVVGPRRVPDDLFLLRQLSEVLKFAIEIGSINEGRKTHTERIPSAPTTRSAVATVPSSNCSSTPLSPLSSTLASLFDSWVVPGLMCDSNADCSAVLWVRTGGRDPGTGLF